VVPASVLPKCILDRFPEQIWDNIGKFLRNLLSLPLWVNRDFSETVFGGKQNNSFWKSVFETGNTHRECRCWHGR